jgi:hypothetical protein
MLMILVDIPRTIPLEILARNETTATTLCCDAHWDVDFNIPIQRNVRQRKQRFFT